MSVRVWHVEIAVTPSEMLTVPVGIPPVDATWTCNDTVVPAVTVSGAMSVTVVAAGDTFRLEEPVLSECTCGPVAAEYVAVTEKDPAAVGVMGMVHVADASAQVPVAPPDSDTVPAGTDFAPASLSVTVTVACTA